MAEPTSTACAPWITTVDLCSPCSDYSFPAGDLNASIQAATDVLFALSGRQFPGVCEATIRPCARACYEQVGACRCSPLSQIRLPYPAIAVSEVLIDGVVLAASKYRIDEWRYLVRLPDETGGTQKAWPSCQRMDRAATEDDTFAVTLTYGRTPPEMGKAAAARLACELALSCSPDSVGDCHLPKRVTSITRQGVSFAILDPFAFLDKGRTGLYEVDLFLEAVNPSGLRRSPVVLSPDTGGQYRRIGT